MKSKLFIFVFMIAMLLMLAGCGSGSIAQSNTPMPNPQSTPAKNGQINVPGVNIQINSPGVSIPVNIPGPNPLVNKPDTQNRVASILTGIWHGIISPVTLVVSFINPNVQMYEVHNDGSVYNFGFLVGVAIVFLILGVIGGSRRH